MITPSVRVNVPLAVKVVPPAMVIVWKPLLLPLILKVMLFNVWLPVITLSNVLSGENTTVLVPASMVPAVWVQFRSVRIVPKSDKVPDALLMFRFINLPTLLVELPVKL